MGGVLERREARAKYVRSQVGFVLHGEPVSLCGWDLGSRHSFSGSRYPGRPSLNPSPLDTGALDDSQEGVG